MVNLRMLEFRGSWERVGFGVSLEKELRLCQIFFLSVNMRNPEGPSPPGFSLQPLQES
jgi:hypothetical protein